MTMSDQSPAIEAKGNVTVKYGLTREQYQEHLRQQAGEFIKAMQSAGLIADARQLHELERKHEAVSAKLADIERSYEEELARRKAADAVFAQLRGQLPKAKIEEAQASLRQGDIATSKQFFQDVLDKDGRKVAAASYYLGQLEERELDFHKAMHCYTIAVLLEEDNRNYLFAAGKMAAVEDRNPEKAIKYFEHLLEITPEKNMDSETLKAQCELAYLYKTEGRLPEAEAMYKKAIKIIDNDINIEKKEKITPLNGLTIIYLAKGEYDKAESFCKHSLSIAESECKETNRHINSMILSADVHFYRKDYNPALNLYKKAMMSTEKLVGKESILYMDILKKIANIYKMTGEDEKYNSLRKISSSILKEKDSITGEIEKNDIGGSSTTTGDVSQNSSGQQSPTIVATTVNINYSSNSLSEQEKKK